jgi:hypothetical protein
VNSISPSRDDIVKKNKHMKSDAIDREICIYLEYSNPTQATVFSDLAVPEMNKTCQKVADKIEAVISNMEKVHKDREQGLKEMHALINQKNKPSVKKQLVGKLSSLWDKATKKSSAEE